MNTNTRINDIQSVRSQIRLLLYDAEGKHSNIREKLREHVNDYYHNIQYYDYTEFLWDIRRPTEYDFHFYAFMFDDSMR